MDSKITSLLVGIIFIIIITLSLSIGGLSLLEKKVNNTATSEPEATIVATITPAPTETPTPFVNNIEEVQVDWEFFVETIQDCQATSITQLHNLEVSATLGGGLVIVAQEPEIDAIFEVYEQVQETCGSIPMVTE